MNNNINWSSAFNTDEFKKAKNNRVHFVIPVLTFFTILFPELFSVQHIFSSVGNFKIYGHIDPGFLFVMSLYPLTGIPELRFTRYAKSHVYPCEETGETSLSSPYSFNLSSRIKYIGSCTILFPGTYPHTKFCKKRTVSRTLLQQISFSPLILWRSSKSGDTIKTRLL